MPNTGHNLHYSINAKHWARYQLFYQYQTTGHDLRDYQCQTLGTISTILSMPNTEHDLNWSINTKPLGTISENITANHRSLSQMIYQCQTNGHDLRDYQCKTLGTIATILSIPNHWAWFQRLSSKTLGTISTILSMPNHWAWSQRLPIQNSGHNLNYSINAKHWALSQMIYQCQTTGHGFRDY